MRGVFFEESDAEFVIAQLGRQGWESSVVRERLAGEDDDEDHPWAVLTDAPDIIFEALVHRYDGWLDTGEVDGPSVTATPVDLPTAPKRIKREQG